MLRTVWAPATLHEREPRAEPEWHTAAAEPGMEAIGAGVESTMLANRFQKMVDVGLASALVLPHVLLGFATCSKRGLSADVGRNRSRRA